MDEKKRRRPRKPRGGDNREPRDNAAKERAEREFRRDETRFHFFLDSDEDELELEPMNSFRRRIAHTVAKEFNFDTESRGEEPNRYVALIKTEDSVAPEGGITPEPEEDDEPVAEQPREAREERRPARSERPPARSERPPARGDRPPRKWDYGNQTFPIEPGADGLRLALKIDGSLEVWRESEEDYIIFDRMVTAREVRIRDGKIVQPGEPGW